MSTASTPPGAGGRPATRQLQLERSDVYFNEASNGRFVRAILMVRVPGTTYLTAARMCYRHLDAQVEPLNPAPLFPLSFPLPLDSGFPGAGQGSGGRE